MSVREEPIYPAPGTVGRVTVARPRPVRERSQPRASRPRAERTQAAADTPASPTTSIIKVLLTLFIGFALALLFGARGLVHSAKGMDDGIMRTVTLKVGDALLPFAENLHLTWPWDRAEEALGRQTQPDVPPLLATGNLQPSGSIAAPKSVSEMAKGQGGQARTGGPTRTGGPDQKQPVAAGGNTLNQPPRRITRADPLRLLVTGDSLVGYLGPELINEMSATAPIRGFTDTHNGTGLTRPDFVDWSLVARQQVASDNPDAVVVMIGGNDFQNMVLGNRVFIAGTAAWTREYQRRAEIVMRTWAQNGRHRVYWLSMPPARDPSWAFDDAHINMALRRAAKDVRGARYVNILGPITNHGHYTDYVTQNGQPVLIRESDGVHLNLAGSTIVAHEMVPVIKRDWRLR